MDSGNDTLLPFRLVDQGFDVWIGHKRSHGHRKVTPSDYLLAIICATFANICWLSLMTDPNDT